MMLSYPLSHPLLLLRDEADIVFFAYFFAYRSGRFNLPPETKLLMMFLIALEVKLWVPIK